MKLHLIDGNNVLRRKFETDPNYASVAIAAAQQGIGPHGNIVWVWDGANAKARRQAIFSKYKQTKDSPDQFYKFMDAFRELLTHTNAMQIRVEGYEADDVIAELVYTKSPETDIYIESNDQDYLQLIQNRVELEYISKDLGELKSDDIRLYKTLCGDKSDEIPGLNRFGHKGYLKLTDPQKCLLEAIIKGEVDLNPAEVKERIGFTQAMSDKLVASQKELKQYWDVIGFIHVPMNAIQQGTVMGQLNPGAIQEGLQRLYLPVTMGGN